MTRVFGLETEYGITIQGASSANALTVGSASSANGSFVDGANQTVVAGNGGQSGSITVLGVAIRTRQRRGRSVSCVVLRPDNSSLQATRRSRARA